MGAAAAPDSVTQEGRLPLQERREAGIHSCCTRFRCLGTFGRGAATRGGLCFFFFFPSSLANRLVPFSSGQTRHANHLWVDPRAEINRKPFSSFQFSVENSDLKCFSLAENLEASPLLVRDLNSPDCSSTKAQVRSSPTQFLGSSYFIR